MSVLGHAISLGSGARMDKHEHSCDACGEYDMFARAWKRENEREPQDIESWDSFLKRLRRTVYLLREKQKHDAGQLCTNQKVRARELQE